MRILFLDDRMDRMERFVDERTGKKDTTIWAKTSQEAIKFLRKSTKRPKDKFGLVSLDFNLLGRYESGRDVACALAVLANIYRDTPIVFHTNSSSAADEMEELLKENGFKKLSYKPFDSDMITPGWVGAHMVGKPIGYGMFDIEGHSDKGHEEADFDAPPFGYQSRTDDWPDF